MSLKIRIKQPIPSDSSKSSKRRIQRIDSDDDRDVYQGDEPRSKRARMNSRAVSQDAEDDHMVDVADEDVDIDGDIEDTRFLPEPLQPPISRPISPVIPSLKLKFTNPATSSSRSRPKEKEKESTSSSKVAKSNKASGKKPRRQVVYTDSEDEASDDPDVVITDDDDFDPEPELSTKKGVKSKSGKTVAGSGKAGGKGKAKPEDKEITFRDERKGAPLESIKRGRIEDDVVKVPDPLDEPIPKKRKLPPIKKNKPAGGNSAGSSTPAAPKAGTSVLAEKKETLTPAPTSNQVGVRKMAGASSDINLLDSSVYSELFKSTPGGVTPNSGLNRKQKEEERKKELNKMRLEARAKRKAEATQAFNLQAAPEKIQRYEDLLRARHSMARYPNIVGAAFKEMFDRQRNAHSSIAVDHR